MTADVALAVLQFLGAFVCVLLLGLRYANLRDTTLTGPCVWACLSLLTLGGTGLWMALEPEGRWNESLRLLAATGTFCPLMAVLGARRPHHAAWNLVVASLWVVAALPALEAMFLGRHEVLDIGAVRGWFLWLVVALGLLNYLPTRFAVSALLVAAGQVGLLSSHLPGVPRMDPLYGMVSATALFLTALMLAIWAYSRRSPATNEFDFRWRAFRDAYGGLWGLRVLERINAAARTYDWPFSLAWTGFYFHEAAADFQTLSPETRQDLRQTMDNLFRRFTEQRGRGA